MAHQSDKYKLFLNFMYNELGISKEDIKGWVRDAVMEVAESYVRHQFDSYSFNNRVNHLIEKEANLVITKGTATVSQVHTISSYIQKVIAEVIAEKIDINVNVKE
jgi:hypothetical protein